MCLVEESYSLRKCATLKIPEVDMSLPQRHQLKPIYWMELDGQNGFRSALEKKSADF